jgi:triosephosphate isomerase (TIM)
MYGSRVMVRDVVSALRDVVVPAEVVVCPPAVYIGLAAELSAGSTLCLGAQDLHVEAEGAFTGDVSAAMLRDAGCSYVIVGHSERRRDHGESDELVARKCRAAQQEGLVPIVCVGESIAEREAGEAFAVVERQLRVVASALGRNGLDRLVVAYEPVWAIGTGLSATPQQAQEVHAFLRSLIVGMDPESGEALRIVYGGSVKRSNAHELFAQPDIDGGLVGGASLDAVEFAAICAAAEGN